MSGRSGRPGRHECGLIWTVYLRLGCLIFVSLWQSPVPAATYAPVTEDELVRRSDAVFVGRVLGARVVERPDGALETRVVVETGEVLKGRLPRKVVLTFPGGGLGHAVDCSSLSLSLRRGETRLFCLTRRADGEIVAEGGPDAVELMSDARPGSPWSRRLARLAERARAQADPGSDWTALAPRGEDLAAVEPEPENPVDVGYRSVTESGLSEFIVPAGSEAHPTRFLAPDRGEPIPYLVDMDTLPEGISSQEALEAVADACAAWTEATGIAFEFEGRASFGQSASTVTTADGLIRVQLHDEYDSIPGTTTLAFGGLRLVNGGLPEGGAGGRVYEREFHRTTQGYVVINHRHAAVSDLESFTEILCHELGHALGLAHSSETPGESDPARKDALMYYLAHMDGRGADLRAYDLETVGKSYPLENKPPFAPNRILDITTHPSQSTLGNPEVNRIGLLGLDRETPGPSVEFALHPARTTANNGDFTLTGSTLSYLATGYYNSPRLDLESNTFYDRALYRAEDGVHASPWASVRVVSFRPDSQPGPVVDGLPDAWIAEHFPGNSFDGGFSDPDGDGSSTFEEYLTETDPQEAASVLRASFSVAETGAPSESGVVESVVTLDRAVLRNVAVPWSVAAESTASADDYVVHAHSASPLVIPAGETSAVLRIDIAEDDAPENAETLILDLGDPEPGVLGALTHMTITIPGEDFLPEYNFSAPAYETAEGNGTFVLESIVLERSVLTDSASSVSVVLAGTSGAPAVPGTDVEAGPVIVEFGLGETQRSVPLSVFGDVIFEADEQVALTLASFQPFGKAGSVQPSAVVTVLNDDPLPAIVWEAVSVPENGGETLIELNLSRPSAFPVGFSLRGQDGSAIAGEDFEALVGDIVISPGETSVLVPLDIFDDNIDEGDETFTLVLEELTGAEATVSSVTLTIIDDDPPPVVTAVSAEVPESAEFGVLLVQLSHPSAHEASIAYATAAGSAIEGEDYLSAADRVVFAPGTVSGSANIPLVNDARHEGVETLTLEFSNPLHASVETGEAVLTILDDDPPPALDFNPLEFAEGEPAALSGSLTVASGLSAYFEYMLLSDSAEAGEDFVAGSGGVVIPAGETAFSISLGLIDDALNEDLERFAIQLDGLEGATAVESLVYASILDNDAAPSLSAGEFAGLEDSGQMEFLIVLSAPSGRAVSVDYQIGDGTAIAGHDYVAAQGSAQFTPGQTQWTGSVNLLNDEIFEGDETLALRLSAPHNAIIGAESGTGWIQDDDTAPRLSVEAVPVVENEGALRFDLTLSNPSAHEVRIDYRIEAGSAEPEDFVGEGGSVVFEPGVVARSLSVMILDDAIDESDETVLLALASESDVLIPPVLVSGLILDDDPPPGLSATSLSVVESDGTARFAVMLSGPSELAVVFAYRTEDGTATAGADFTERSGEAEITAGATSVSVDVLLIDDGLWESEETFSLVLERLDGGEPGVVRVEARILDDDPVGDLPGLAIVLGPEPGRLTLSWEGTGDYTIDWSIDMVVWRRVEDAEPVDLGGVQRVVIEVRESGTGFFRLVRGGE